MPKERDSSSQEEEEDDNNQQGDRDGGQLASRMQSDQPTTFANDASFERPQQSPQQSAQQQTLGNQKRTALEASNENLEEAESSDEVDSVDNAFQEYSDSTRDEIRELEKGAWDESDPSLDPADDVDTFLSHGLKLPPDNYDALMMAGQMQFADLDALRTAKLTPQAQARAQYRRGLVDGVSLEDQRWLKLRAYHRAVENIRAGRAAACVGNQRREQLEAVGAPLDIIPQDMIDTKPQQLAERRAHLEALVAPAPRADGRLGPLLGLDAAGRYYPLERFVGPSSDESEWDPNWQGSGPAAYGFQHDPVARLALQEGLMVSLAPPNSASAAMALPPAAAESSGWEESEGGTVAVTLYTPAHLERVALQRRQRRQERRRSQAFWLALLAAGGFSIWRLVRRLQRGSRKTKNVIGGAMGRLTSSALEAAGSGRL